MSTRIIALPVNAGKEPLIFNTIWQTGKFFWPSIINLAMLTKKVKDQIESGEPVKEPAMCKDKKESHEVTSFFLDYHIEPNDVGRLEWDAAPTIISLRKKAGLTTKIENNKLTVIKEA